MIPRWATWLGLGLGGALVVGAAWPKRMRVSAWTGYAGIIAPEKTLARAKALGLDGLDCMVNDATGNGEFHTYDDTVGNGAIANAFNLWRAGGLDVCATSWCKPTLPWVQGMRAVGQIAKAGRAKGLNFDLEEPWTANLKGASGAVVEQWTAQAFDNAQAGFAGPLGVTAIVYANEAILAPAFRRANVLIPQAYANNRSSAGLAVGRLETVAVERYKRWGKRLIMGLAGYDLDGAYGGLDQRQAILAGLNTCQALGVKEVRYWRLETLTGGAGEELAAWMARGGKAVG